jgi:hypothetical protein
MAAEALLFRREFLGVKAALLHMEVVADKIATQPDCRTLR